MKLCIICRKSNNTATKRCSPCRDKANSENRERREKWKQFGLCSKCGRELDAGSSSECLKCLSKHKRREKKRRRRLIESSQCYQCGKPFDGEQKSCPECLAKRKEDNRKVKREVFDHYGKQCQCCSETIFAFLTIDHINGGGTEERRRLKKQGTYFYRHLRKQKYPPGYQVLCFNCNAGKYLNGGTCPHELLRLGSRSP